MQKFIGVKLVEAELATHGEFYPAHPTFSTPKDPATPGYRVTYSSGYASWCPADEFEKQNLPIIGAQNKVSQKDVDAMIKQISVEVIEPNDIGSKVTVVTATLANGFTITESSTCVDPNNYDPEVGVDVCMKRIKDKVWMLLGFLLSCGVNGFQKAVV